MDTNQQSGRALVSATPDDELVRVLGQSLYPGARPESIRLVLAWCKATGRDPMKKPIHIVPMRVKDQQTGKYEWRDTLMPGIGTYRSDAATTGQYAGLDEPEYGPDVRGDVDGCELTYPAWCKVTVKRLVGGQERSFSAKELWLENYASGEGGKGVNAMWRKRPYGQLAKVAEAQALRKAFPDECGQTNTTDEMEGKTFVGETIDATADPATTKREPAKTVRAERYQTEAADETTTKQQPEDEAERISAFMAQTDTMLRTAKNGSEAHKVLIRAYELAPTLDDLAGLEGHPFRRVVRDTFPSYLREAADKACADATERLGPKDKPWADPTWDAPTNGNGKHDLSGHGTNTTAATAEASTPDAVREEVAKVAGELAAHPDDTEEEGKEWMPGDP